MIGRLHGTVVEQVGTRAVIDCAGVGYEVNLSTHSLSELGPEGSEVILRVYTHFIKSDFSITLYGFTSARERELFDLLITVKNVGPASAMKILSAGSSPVDIAGLIAAGKTTQLTSLRGVGKKSAELLVVELREKCETLLRGWGHTDGPGSAAAIGATATGARVVRPPLLEDVAQALGQLGWRPSEVDKAVAVLVPEPGATLEGLLRQALRSMPR